MTGNEPDTHEKVFMAYSRKLLRELEKLRLLLLNGEVLEGEKLLDEMILDTKMDIELKDARPFQILCKR